MFLGKKAPHSAIGMLSPYKVLHGTELDLRLLRVVGARAFVHIEKPSPTLDVKAVEGRLVGYTNNSKSYRVYNPVIQRIMESRNIIFIETLPRLLPPPSEVSHTQPLPSSNATGIYNYTTDGDFLRDLRDYPSVLEPLTSSSADHITAGGLSMNPPEAKLLDRISNITGRDALAG